MGAPGSWNHDRGGEQKVVFLLCYDGRVDCSCVACQLDWKGVQSWIITRLIYTHTSSPDSKHTPRWHLWYSFPLFHVLSQHEGGSKARVQQHVCLFVRSVIYAGGKDPTLYEVHFVKLIPYLLLIERNKRDSNLSICCSPMHSLNAI